MNTDVRQALCRAFEQSETILRKTDTLLNSFTDRSPAAVSRQAGQWEALLRMMLESSSRMAFRLAEARSRDTETDFDDFSRRAADLAGQYRSTADALREKIDALKREISDRKKRRPSVRPAPPPSVVDLRI